jgi:tyrosine-specific transport protein
MVKAISAATVAFALACACCPEVSAFSPISSTLSSRRHSLSVKLQQSSFTDDSRDLVVNSAAANDGATTDAPTFENPLVAKLQEKIGTVSQDRILFPELITGEVPRMFSSLEYNKNEQGTISAVHKAGSTLGAAALVAGTTIGAGILALPTATAAAGFVPSSAALVGAWAYMTMSGLLIAELSLNQMGVSGKPGSGLLQLFENNLGPNLAKVGSGAYFFLHYAVMVAYIAQGGSNLNGFLQNAGLSSLADIPASGQVLFAGATALALFCAEASQVATLNNVLVLGVVVSFLGIVGIGASTADFSALLDPIHQHPEEVLNAFPILFLSLVFQNIVPTVVNQLEGDRTKITKAIVGGTSVPLLMFLAWNGVILGNVLAHDPTSLGTIDPVALLQSGTQGGPLLGTLIGAFSELALITSLIGFVYGLLDALTDVAKLPVKGPEFEKWKPALFAGVFLPPLALSTNPGIFYDALEYGGAFGVSTLFLVLPPLMVWKARYGDDTTPLTTAPMVPFGKIPLGSMYKAAGTLIIEQGCEKLGLIDFAQTHIAPILSHFTS